MSIKATQKQTEIATFGGGCFWCTEAIFQKLKGVKSVTSGYAGGARSEPTYEQVSTGATGHAEVVQIDYDPNIIAYKTLLQIFWHTHNPTTLNQQGADVGTQYRSVIFYHSIEQQELAEQSKQETEKSRIYPGPIVTQILPYENFYPAEAYHQHYFESQPNAPYCQVVIQPKIQKLINEYSNLIK